MTTPVAIIDLREIIARDRDERVLRTFDGLRAGTILELICDNEPVALRARLEAQRPRCFEWETVEDGPAAWRIRIAKRDGADIA